MSSVIEIKQDEENLQKSLAYVNQQRPIDQKLQTRFQNTDKSYRNQINPLQKEFDEKLKQYMELMTEYYDKYVDLANEQNAQRKASWDEQMRKYNNFNYGGEDEVRNQVLQEQKAWKDEQGTLNTDYDTAVTEYNTALDAWEKTKTERETLVKTIKQEMTTSKKRRLDYAASHDSDYDNKVLALYEKNRRDLMTVNRTYNGSIKDKIGLLTSEGAGHTKQVQVVDAIHYDGRRVIMGINGTANCKRQSASVSWKKTLVRIGNLSKSYGSSEKTVTINYVSGPMKIAKSISPWSRGNNGAQGYQGMNSKGRTHYNDRFSVSINNNRITVKRLDITGIGWGQDMYLYVGVLTPELSSSTVGNPTKKTIWGSSLKYSKVWGNNTYGIYSAFTIENVPKSIWYPHGEWNTKNHINLQEDDGGMASTGYYVFMQVFFVSGDQLVDCNSSGFLTGYADDACDVYINGLQVTTTIRGGWGGRPKKIAFSMSRFIHQGSNIITVRVQNTGGPAALVLALFGSKKTNNGMVDYENMFVSTNEDWIALRSDVKIPLLGTNHKGRTCCGGFNKNFQTDDWMDGFHKSMKQTGYFDKIGGTSGVQTHNYQPPSAKVKYIRVSFGQRPTAEAYIQISQLAVYPVDDMKKNVAQNQVVKAHSVFQNGPAIAKNAVNGQLKARPYPRLYHSDLTGGWDKQFFEIALVEDVQIYKIDFFGRMDCCQDRARALRIELFDKNKDIVFQGPPFGSDATEQSFYFNSPVVPENTDPKPAKPVKGTLSRDFPVYTPGEVPPYPVMPGFETPDQTLLNTIIGLSDDLITLNLRIQGVYKKYTMDGTITAYQASVSDRRRDLVNQVLGMIKERNELTEKVNEYVATQKNQLDQERRATGNYSSFWIWFTVAISLAIALGVYLFAPKMLVSTPNMIAWVIIIMTTLITSQYIGGSITFMLWLIILVNIFFYVLKKYYGAHE